MPGRKSPNEEADGRTAAAVHWTLAQAVRPLIVYLALCRYQADASATTPPPVVATLSLVLVQIKWSVPTWVEDDGDCARMWLGVEKQSTRGREQTTKYPIKIQDILVASPIPDARNSP